MSSRVISYRRQVRKHVRTLEAFENRLALSASAMLADVNSVPDSYLSASEPIEVGELTFLNILDPRYGSELWVFDAGSDTPRMVKDINPGRMGADPSWLTNYNGRLYFAANDGLHGTELWTSDGTAEGTHLVADISPLTVLDEALSSSPAGLTVFNGHLAFIAEDAEHGRELWRSDGTAAGTSMIIDLAPGEASGAFAVPTSQGVGRPLVEFQGELYFSGSQTLFDTELWATNGAADGTRLVKDVQPNEGSSFDGSSPGMFTASADFLYFIAESHEHGSQVWRTDGTEQGTILLADIYGFDENQGGRPDADLELVGETLFFWTFETTQSAQLWYTDGTLVGSHSIVSISGDVHGMRLHAIGSRAYFAAPSFQNRSVVWSSDGTSAGTGPLSVDTASPTARGLRVVGNRLYFSGRDVEHGEELWTSDGSAAGTQLVADLHVAEAGENPAVSGSSPLIVGEVREEAMFLVHRDDVSSLMLTDGTEEGTRLLFDEPPVTRDSLPTGWETTPFVAADGSTYFVADDGAHGRELWRRRSDGAVMLVVDLFPGLFHSDPDDLTEFQGAIYFVAYDPEFGHSVFRTLPDGGTVERLEYQRGFGAPSGARELTRVGDELYVVADTAEFGGIWRLAQDGQFELFHGAQAESHVSSPRELTAFGDSLAFVDDLENSPSASVFTKRPGESIVLISDQAAANASSGLTAVNDRLYFTAVDEQGRELWVSDGSSNSALRVADVNPGPSSANPRNFVAAGDRLYFVADHDEYGIELWTATNGVADAQRLTEWNYFEDHSISEMEAIGERLFFAADSLGSGRELWTTDGTPDGTRQVADIFPGERGSRPTELTNVNGTLVFIADDGVHGRELWRADAEGNGAWLLNELSPGRGNFSPRSLRNVHGVLYFVANDGTHGFEPWSWTRTAGDVDLDGNVGLSDLNAVRNHFGDMGDMGPGDVTGDGFVGLEDLNAVRNSFGSVSIRVHTKLSTTQSASESRWISSNVADALFTLMGDAKTSKATTRVTRRI
jgi:ELWxxDGT repeat protein